jgi:hypothetical protein
MKRIFLLFSLVVMIQAVTAQDETLRKMFFAAQTESAKKDFYNYCVNLQNKTNTQIAYSGVAAAMYAEVVSNVSDKLQFFNSGKSIIEKSIARDSYNPELRFLRFSVQEKAPRMLGYSGNMEEDADLIYYALTHGFANKTENYWSTVIKFIASSGISEKTKQKFKNL